ncbi:zinc finger FYVE domain-containing protein 9 isoform X3 [Clupea harengus]|uniref:Zinc finger FYVE domain-containing protein 9 isoform X3 n=1 Tax=Clupea harengus TaxID=7950 RepID=A0A6P3VM88_CLUHA|nr:zinc finger FYVE domain-containing protein 9 isoform X3 [Clupea harengus]
MENYFQTEALNLDKVLDEFEQNEDKTDSSTLSDARWTPILAPPPNFSVGSPFILKPTDSSASLVYGPFRKLSPVLQSEVWSEDNNLLDIHGPILPQPTIGKLLTNRQHEGFNNGYLFSEKNTGVPEKIFVHGQVTSTPSDSPAVNRDEGSFLHNLGHEKWGMLAIRNEASSTDMTSGTCGEVSSGECCGLGQSFIQDSTLMDDYDRSTTVSETTEYGSGPENKAIAENRMYSDTLREREKKEKKTMEEDRQYVNESLSITARLSPDCCKYRQMTLSLQSLGPSKEDSVMEEKEVEESRPEETTEAEKKLNSGGARPKQPVSLKLPPILGQAQNEFRASEKTGHLDVQNQANSVAAPPLFHGLEGRCDFGVVRLNDENSKPSPPRLLGPFESPDNDLKAGPREALFKEPLGEVAPVWVPDSKAPICMKCEIKFTFTKRRHHCRACGKVFCAACCSLRSKLMYMDRKEARVCVTCHSTLMNCKLAQSGENTVNCRYPRSNPNNTAEPCSAPPHLQQTETQPLSSAHLSVTQHSSEDSLPDDQRRLLFADGVQRNAEATEQTSATQTLATQQFSNQTHAVSGTEVVQGHRVGQVNPLGNSISLIPADGLPPILISTGIKGDSNVEEKPSERELMQRLEEDGPDPLVFILNANLLAMIKLVNYVNRKCWFVTTKGMHAVGQAEVVVLLQCLPDEKTIPKDIFCHFVQIYQEALSGNVLGHLGHSFFTQSFLGSKEHGGFLYVTPTFQSVQDLLLLPDPPYLFGILIQKWETPWAKVFPIRLMLRLGAEYRFYPCPLVSVRFRKPLFGETGHTIINLLADFRNYQYTLPMVAGLVVDMEVRKTSIKIPSNRYNELMKALNKSNEHVLAMGACFNERADSHLVCVQSDDGNYQTQAISVHHQIRKVTGACFFVFSGSLKASSGYLAKTSIVEDGVMVQITAETMEELRRALKDMKDYSISCGNTEQEQEHVHIQWTEDDHNFNQGVTSPIDGKSMESINSIKILHGPEYKANEKVIRWTEVFFLRNEDRPYVLNDPAEHSRLSESVARAFCAALCPHLKMLKEDGMAKLGLRVTLDSDQVGYLVGSNGQPLLPQYLSDLDSALIPVIHSGACQLNEGPVVMELIFYILEIIF